MGGRLTTTRLMICLSLVMMGMNFVQIAQIQMQLTDNMPVALTMSLILTVGPAALASLLVPSTPVGMMVQRIQAKTWGNAVGWITLVIFVYYQFEVNFSWWSLQPAAQEGLVWHQIGIAIVATLLIPAVMWVPMKVNEAWELARQAQQVAAYEMATEADIAIRRAALYYKRCEVWLQCQSLLYAQGADPQILQRGYYALRNEMGDIQQCIRAMASTNTLFTDTNDGQDIQDFLSYTADTITDNPLSRIGTRGQQ